MIGRAFAIAVLIVIVLGGHRLLATDIDNCCFVNRQCVTDQEWTDGYQAFQQNECPVSQPVASVSAPVSAPAGQPVDNCCYVNRQCATNRDWVDGYHAFQRNECPAGTTSAQPTSPQPVTGAPATIDNCCFAGWQCHSDEEWQRGYRAYQSNQCAGPAQSSPAPQQIPAGVNNCCHVNQQCATEADWIRGWEAFRDYRCDPAGSPPESRDVGVAIVGGAGFKDQMVESLLLMRRRARFWYDYTVKVLNRIVQTGSYENTYVDTKTGIFYLHYGNHWPAAFTRHEHLVFTASILVHEACHIYREQAGLESGGLVGERACTEKQLAAHVAIDPNDPRANEHRETLATIHDPSTWWW